MTELAADHVTAAADLGRRDANRTPTPYDLDATSALVVARVRTDETLEVRALEGYLAAPLHPRGSAVVHDPVDFGAYVARLATTDHTTMWADLAAGRVVAVLDDQADADAAGWRAHTITLAMQEDPDWAAWLRYDGERREQSVFAEHIEQLTHTIVTPSAADMLEMVSTFHAKRDVQFRQAVKVTSGDVQLTYEEDTKASAGTTGQMEVPRQFTVAISPWVTVDPVELVARLRWRIENGQLRIGYALLRPDRAKRAAFDTVQAAVRGGTAVPLLLGSPPAAVIAQR
jgi:uncharacterized protein YfdQ (DUF2303 family)